MTIEEHFNKIENPQVRERALSYAAKNNALNRECCCLSTALQDGFVWSTTQEGFHYWYKLYEVALGDNFKNR